MIPRRFLSAVTILALFLPDGLWAQERSTRSTIPSHLLLFAPLTEFSIQASGPDSMRTMISVPDSIAFNPNEFWSMFPDNFNDAMDDEYWPLVFYFNTPEDRAAIRKSLLSKRTNPYQTSYLSEAAGKILEATTLTLNEEINKKSDIRVIGPDDQLRLPHLKSKDENEKDRVRPFTYDPEENGYYYFWLYVNSAHAEGVQAVWDSRVGIGCNRTDKADVRLLGRLPPEGQPWNGNGDVWKLFIDAQKLINANDVSANVGSADDCTEDGPCPIPIAIHPKVLNEMVQKWSQQEIPPKLKVSEEP